MARDDRASRVLDAEQRPAPAVERDGSAARDAAADAIRNAELAELWTAIAELPRPQREALLLREIRGLSYVQLAEELSLSAPATRSLLARARQRLRVRLRDLQAALGGASWIETLARLFAGGGSPVAPATRAAALGLGAAAIAGGAIVTPSALEHHVRRPVAVATVAGPAHDKAPRRASGRSHASGSLARAWSKSCARPRRLRLRVHGTGARAEGRATRTAADPRLR